MQPVSKPSSDFRITAMVDNGDERTAEGNTVPKPRVDEDTARCDP